MNARADLFADFEGFPGTGAKNARFDLPGCYNQPFFELFDQKIRASKTVTCYKN